MPPSASLMTGRTPWKPDVFVAQRILAPPLFTLVRGDNPAALQTYLRHGFHIVGTARRHAKVRGRYLDETLIERFLSPAAL